MKNELEQHTIPHFVYLDEMTPSLIRACCGLLAFLAPSLSLRSSPSPKPWNNQSVNMSLKVPGNRAGYVRSCAAAIIAVASTQGPASSSATTPTTVVSSPAHTPDMPNIRRDASLSGADHQVSSSDEVQVIR